MKQYFSILLTVLLTMTSCGHGNKAVAEADSIPCEETITEPVLEKWTLNHYTDEFGEESEACFAGMVVEGSFSNSATTNSPLIVRILVDDNDVRFDLYEYGNMKVKNRELFRFKAKLPNDSIVEFTTFNDGEGRNSMSQLISEDLEKIQAVKELFKTHKEIKFSVICDEYGSPSTYRFVYQGDPSSFDSVYKKIEPSK